MPAAELNAATLVCAAAYFSLWAVADVLGLSGQATAAIGGAPPPAVLPPPHLGYGTDAGTFAAAIVRVDELAEILGAHGAQIAYLALVTTAVAQWLQAYGQSRVSAQDAALIYALDPVYAAGFSYVLLGERLGPQGFAGVLVVLLAVAISRHSDFGDADSATGTGIATGTDSCPLDSEL